MTLDRLWAGWRSTYIDDVANEAPTFAADVCVFCRILQSGLPDESTYVVWRGTHAFAILNAYPYTSGHLLVMPFRHVADLSDVTDDEAHELWATLRSAATAVRAAYAPDGMNIGANLGRAAGAGVPGHFHLHALPRWAGDTNFMTSVAEVRVLPEPLDRTYAKLNEAWPR